jgi:lipoprotein-anchoring transpeptidase ErfK/SrfK
MPFMQMYDPKGIAFHAGPNPGYPASHGCVRLPKAFAEKLFTLTKVGTEVIIEG